MNNAEFFDFAYASSTKLNDDEYKNILNNISIQINQPSTNYSFVSRTNNKYYRSLFVATANTETLQNMAQSKAVDKECTVFLAHQLLIKFSHIFQPSPHDLNAMLDIILNHKNEFSHVDVGTTFSYGLGFLIGKCLYEGVPVSYLHHICKKPFIESKIDFAEGFKSGHVKKSKGLLYDKIYMSDLKDRYSEWSSQSQNTSLRSFYLMGSYSDLEKPILNIDNQKTLWFLKGFLPNSTFVQKLCDDYDNVIYEASLTNEISEIKEKIKEILPSLKENIFPSEVKPRKDLKNLL